MFMVEKVVKKEKKFIYSHFQSLSGT